MSEKLKTEPREWREWLTTAEREELREIEAETRKIDMRRRQLTSRRKRIVDRAGRRSLKTRVSLPDELLTGENGKVDSTRGEKACQ